MKTQFKRFSSWSLTQLETYVNQFLDRDAIVPEKIVFQERKTSPDTPYEIFVTYHTDKTKQKTQIRLFTDNGYMEEDITQFLSDTKGTIIDMTCEEGKEFVMMFVYQVMKHQKGDRAD